MVNDKQRTVELGENEAMINPTEIISAPTTVTVREVHLASSVPVISPERQHQKDTHTLMK